MTDNRLTLGLVAHDDRKTELCAWAAEHRDILRPLRLFGTGTSAARLTETNPGLQIQALKSGPLGGDQQLGAMICEGKLDALVFFIDPMSPHPHDVDIKALLRLAILYNIPFACNRVTANLLAKNLLIRN